MVLGIRTSGVGAVQAEIFNARYAPSQVETIPVGELSQRDARALVNSLADGLDLRFPVRDYFAGQAVDSPYVAVIGLNLIRRGELTAPLMVDDALRQQVLARYQEIAAGEIAGFTSRTVRQVLAVYAALGPIDESDDQLRVAVAQFVNLELGDLLRLCQGLQDRGTLVTRNDLTRLVPDVLADDILESEAAAGRHATGFVQRLWEAFGSPYDDRLVVTLAELDWRLTHRGGPSIIRPIWASVVERLRNAELVDLYRALRGLRGLATLLPGPFLNVLEELRPRLQREAAARGNAITSRSENPNQALWLLAELYGQCAASAPETLETVLNALWMLCRYDNRPTNSNPDHPMRVIVDRLASIGDMVDPTFPLRIVAWADAHLTQGRETLGTTPMSVMRPFLAKDITRTVAETRRRISIRPYAVSAGWARPVRDAIRATLLREAGGTELRRAGEAVRLLGTAIRQPTGSVGRTVTREEILGWEQDDLATLVSFEAASGTTASPVIRRMIRHEIAWPAERSGSVLVRHAALTLVTSLDERDDDLAEALLNAHRGLPSRRGVPLPELEELQAADVIRLAHEAGLPEDVLEAERSERIRHAVEERPRMREQQVTQVVTRLAAAGVSQMVEELRTCSSDIDAAAAKPPTLWGFWRQLVSSRLELVPEVVREVSRGPASVLDNNLDQLLDAWEVYDSAGLLAWLADEANLRIEIRLVVANAFANYGWTDRGEAFVEQLHRGLKADEPELRERYVIGTHRLLAADPAGTARILRGAFHSPHVLTRALESACGYDGLVWGRNLGKQNATAVLELISWAGWEDHTVQQIAAGIAWTHPVLVLDELQALSDLGGQLPTDVDGFADAFDDNAEVLTRWIIDRVRRGNADSSTVVVSIVMAGNMTAAQAHHLSEAVEQGADISPAAVVSALEDLGGWPLQHPGLARQLLAEARALDDDAANQLLEGITRAMTPTSWGFVNGQSAEINRTKTTAAKAASAETDSDLRAAFRAAEAWATHYAEQLMAEDLEDDD
ncbi:hypothetical protein CLV67_1541 [Actinoplanes italicus]|uniref:Uncharacterized protein n=1 Tax=Actinoplanes italicus TaxID=113567 RepID=A0A2T0J7E8_9ACTN|nr:hypothetical protein CLV67_1541 [Actinoplanes italicus]